VGLTTVLRAKLARAIKRLAMGLGILSLGAFLWVLRCPLSFCFVNPRSGSWRRSEH